MERGDRGIQRVCHQVVGQSCWSTIEKKQRAIGHDRFQNDHEGPTGSAGIDLPARRDEPFSATHDEPPMPQAAILFHDALTARGWVFEIVVGMEIAARNDAADRTMGAICASNTGTDSREHFLLSPISGAGRFAGCANADGIRERLGVAISGSVRTAARQKSLRIDRWLRSGLRVEGTRT
jgi:hypothetical protein